MVRTRRKIIVTKPAWLKRGILFSEMLYIPTTQFQDLVLHLSLFMAIARWMSSLFFLAPAAPGSFFFFVKSIDLASPHKDYFPKRPFLMGPQQHGSRIKKRMGFPVL